MTSINDQSSINGLKGMLSYYLFMGNVGTTASKEYTKPLYIPPGLDSMGSIGEPKVNYKETVEFTQCSAWKHKCDRKALERNRCRILS